MSSPSRGAGASSFAFFILAATAGFAAQANAVSSYFPLWQKTAPNIADLALIYCGGEGRLAWMPDQFAPYVSFKDPRSGKESWLFDGFLFIEFCDGRGYEFVHGVVDQKSARQREWLWLLQRVFEPGHGVPALDQTCAEVEKRIGPPARRRQAVLTLPEPLFNQKDWGELDGRKMDFSKPDDRVAACEWYMKTALSKWRELGPKHLDLAGFYWVAEDDVNGREILPRIARAIHAEGKRFFWIPYWTASGAADWRQLGFDVASQQPNHFMRPEIPDARLAEACAFAKRHGMGMEIEFDERVRTAPEKFRARLLAYLSAFERNGAAAEAAIAYYEGGGEFLKLATSHDKELQQLHEQVARWVLARQQKADQLARNVTPQTSSSPQSSRSDPSSDAKSRP
jgi:hypothetical protein